MAEVEPARGAVGGSAWPATPPGIRSHARRRGASGSPFARIPRDVARRRPTTALRPAGETNATLMAAPRVHRSASWQAGEDLREVAAGELAEPRARQLGGAGRLRAVADAVERGDERAVARRARTTARSPFTVSPGHVRVAAAPGDRAGAARRHARRRRSSRRRSSSSRTRHLVIVTTVPSPRPEAMSNSSMSRRAPGQPEAQAAVGGEAVAHGGVEVADPRARVAGDDGQPVAARPRARLRGPSPRGRRGRRCCGRSRRSRWR